jgi:integrase
MARHVRDTNLGTRDARKRLKMQGKPYWKAMDQGLHLGYRKRSSGGTWVARRLNEEGKYKEKKLGAVDDYQDADGVTILSFSHAQAAARDWFLGEVRKEHGDHIAQGPATVADALSDYMANYAVEGKGLVPTTASVNAHILPVLGHIPLDRLTTKKITNWHYSLASSEPLLRTAKTAEKRNTRPLGNDADSIRRRRATANRVLTILKAALNYAWKEGRIATDTAWRKVKPFRNVDAPVIRYLTEGECKRLVNACPEDFRQMVKGALFSGCRYAELTTLKVADFNPDAGTIAIRTSKSGKPRHIILTEEGITFFEEVTSGKKAKDLIFTHNSGAAWGESHQSRPLREACRNASIDPAISFHVLRHTHGSLLAMQGVPMQVIAQQLGHADTRMTEKHYAHLSPSYVADTIRQHFPKLGLADASKIKPIIKRSGRA